MPDESKPRKQAKGRKPAKSAKQPFIERKDRPTPIDYDQPLGELRLRDLLSIIESRTGPAVSLPRHWPPPPEWTKPEHIKPEQLKPEHIKPEWPKPEHIKPEQFKPEQFKPEQFKPEWSKPEGLKPPEGMPGGMPGGMVEPSRGPSMADLVNGVERQLLEGIELLAAERSRRMVERTTVPMGVLATDDDHTALGLLLPGTVTVFVAEAGSRLLEDVAEVVAAGDDQTVADLVDRVSAEAAHRGRMDPLATATDLATGRVFANLRYGSKLLAENLGLPYGLEFGVISFPYAGVELDAKSLVLDQFVRHDFQERLDAIAVVRPPRLSDAERAAVELVPPDQREIGIASPGHVAVTVTTVTIALFVVAVHTPTLTGGRSPRDLFARLDRVNVAADRIARLQSPGTVAELVSLRRSLQAELF